MKQRNLIFVILLIFVFPLSALNITYIGGKTYTLVERTDLRRYDNGKYIGLMSREIKACITPVASENGFLYDGNFYVNQDTRRGISYVNNGIHDAIPSCFSMTDDGQLQMLQDLGYPTFRSFPSFPKSEVSINQSWEAAAERTVDPLNKGIFTKIPMYVQYTYLRDEEYHGEPVYLLSAKWATRYGAGTKIYDPNGDAALQSASGNHNATIYISKITGNALVIRDSVEEMFAYADGNKITFKGTISLFTEYPPTVNAEDVEKKLIDVKDLDFEKTEAGIKLTLSNLQFKPNSSELLEGESVRLVKIAEVLRNLPKSQFLVEGHTADTGNPKGEMQLSLERSHEIVNKLVQLGVPVESFICKGSGSTKPISDNKTPEGKAKNRRVEITILE